MLFFSSAAPPSLAVALGATTPAGPGPGARIWSTLTGCELVWDGSAWMIASEGVQRVRLGTDFTNSTTTQSDVSGLSFSVQAGVTYVFEFWLVWRCAATTASGIGISISGPASPTSLAYFVDTPTSATARTLGNRRAYDVFGATTAIDAANSDSLAMIQGVLTPSASGTLVVRARAGTAGSLATVKAGSCGVLRAMTNSGNVASNPPISISQNAATSYTFNLTDANTEEEFTAATAVSATVPPES